LLESTAADAAESSLLPAIQKNLGRLNEFIAARPHGPGGEPGRGKADAVVVEGDDRGVRNGGDPLTSKDARGVLTRLSRRTRDKPERLPVGER